MGAFTKHIHGVCRVEDFTEINFYKCHGGGAVNGGEEKCCGQERSWQGGWFSAVVYNQLFHL